MIFRRRVTGDGLMGLPSPTTTGILITQTIMAVTNIAWRSIPHQGTSGMTLIVQISSNLFANILQVMKTQILGQSKIFSIMITGLKWTKIYAHDIDGGFFADLEEAKKKNVNDENAQLFSKLYDLESMKDNDGVFHFKLCHPELTEAFPCNEWKQSSNPIVETSVSGFEGIRLTYPLRSDRKPFGGLMKSNPSENLMDDIPTNYWWNSIGTIKAHGGKIPGPVSAGKGGISVKKKELYVYTQGNLI